MACFRAFDDPPKSDKVPHAYRWYKLMATFKPTFASLPGDMSKPYTSYGPEISDHEDTDLFLYDDEGGAARLGEQRLEEYRTRTEGRVRPAAKCFVTLDVKPWGTYRF